MPSENGWSLVEIASHKSPTGIRLPSLRARQESTAPSERLFGLIV
jgi:hypothetical protein